LDERLGEATINGSPLTVAGRKLKPGDTAPDVELEEWALVPFKLLSDTAGKIRLISVVPCIDTGLCEMQTLRMSDIASQLDERVVTITVSADLPAGQARFCGKAGVDNVIMLSDHMEMSFGSAYGTWLREMRAEQRSVFVVDEDNVVRHAQYVPEIGHAIDYEAAFSVVRKLLRKPSDGSV
jgi:thioredoxin-dependent peroxiredoxin